MPRGIELLLADNSSAGGALTYAAGGGATTLFRLVAALAGGVFSGTAVVNAAPLDGPVSTCVVEPTVGTVPETDLCALAAYPELRLFIVFCLTRLGAIGGGFEPFGTATGASAALAATA